MIKTIKTGSQCQVCGSTNTATIRYNRIILVVNCRPTLIEDDFVICSDCRSNINITDDKYIRERLEEEQFNFMLDMFVYISAVTAIRGDIDYE